MRTLTKIAGVGTAAGTALVAQAANAQAATTGALTDLTAAADFSDVKKVMISIAFAVMGVLVLWFGIRKAKRSIGG